MGTKLVLAVTYEFGFWGNELVVPLRNLEAAGYTFDFATPKGARAPCLPPSWDTNCVDPALVVCGTTPEDKALVDTLEASDAVGANLNLSEMFPKRPYHSARDFLQSLGSYSVNRKAAQGAAVSAYDAVILVGGSVPAGPRTLRKIASGHPRGSRRDANRWGPGRARHRDRGTGKARSNV